MQLSNSKRMHDALILIVDDIELNRKILMTNLLARGFTNLIQAKDGAQSLQMTRENRPDLVILDLMMPGMDGFAYCQAVRQDASFNNMPIIVQTALDEMENKLRAFSVGATDYICKPVDPGELEARVRVHLANKLLMEDLNGYNQRISAEMEAARAMQNRIMPNGQQIKMCERAFEMNIASYFETSSTLGGDCWGMRALSGNHLSAFMYDFSGHGISAAMNIFRMHTIMQEYVHMGGEPGNFLTTINRHLYPLLERHEFATMFYSVIDTDANTLLYASAAAPSAAIFHGGNAAPRLLDERSYGLGVLADAVYETHSVPLLPGDLLLFFSDCLTETMNKQGEFVQEAQLFETAKNALLKNSPAPARQVVDDLVAMFRSHAPEPIMDDLTINAYWRFPRNP